MSDRAWRRMRIVQVFVLVATFVSGCSGECSSGPDDPVPDDGTVYPPHHEMPAWSRQGLIAYVDRGVEDPSLRGIWILDPTTGGAHQVLPYGLYPDWSPDGERLAFARDAQIYAVPAVGGEPTQLTFEERNFYPDWSPDGSQIAWMQTVGSQAGVWTMASGGGDRRFLVPGGNPPDWHPDGRTIVCSGWQNSVHGILECDVESGKSTFVKVDGAAPSTESILPQYSPDGARIAFTVWTDGELEQVWVMNADGSEETQLTEYGGTYPSWSPDGASIVYLRDNRESDAPEDGVLWVVNVATGTESQLTFKR
jgi:Tol biopolymer transport system component